MLYVIKFVYKIYFFFFLIYEFNLRFKSLKCFFFLFNENKNFVSDLCNIIQLLKKWCEKSLHFVVKACVWYFFGMQYNLHDAMHLIIVIDLFKIHFWLSCQKSSYFLRYFKRQWNEKLHPVLDLLLFSLFYLKTCIYIFLLWKASVY